MLSKKERNWEIINSGGKKTIGKKDVIIHTIYHSYQKVMIISIVFIMSAPNSHSLPNDGDSLR